MDDSLATTPPLLPACPSQLLSIFWLSEAPKRIYALVLHKGKVMVFLPLFVSHRCLSIKEQNLCSLRKQAVLNYFV